MLKAYVINLDRSPERMERMSALLRTMSIMFERIPAVDGATLTEDAIQDIIDIPPHELQPSPTEIGCYLSHTRAWERIARGRDDYGLVLEDDVIFAKNFASILDSPKLFAEHPDLVRFEGWK